MSKVVIHQPEYLPWINLFIKMSLCEKFVFLDNVQYARRSFQNRNIINANNQLSYITVPIEYSDRDTLINEIKNLGIKIVEGNFELKELETAHSIWLTSSTKGLAQVTDIINLETKVIEDHNLFKKCEQIFFKKFLSGS